MAYSSPRRQSSIFDYEIKYSAFVGTAFIIARVSERLEGKVLERLKGLLS